MARWWEKECFISEDTGWISRKFDIELTLKIVGRI
jgi:hypothetical protein